MSRSKRKTLAGGNTTSPSEKRDKQQSHRKIRRRVKQVIQVNPETEPIPLENELTNTYSMSKDGKRMYDPETQAYLYRK